MPKRLTTEEFIEKARSVHGNKYDYSRVEFVNFLTKVFITCPVHGEFLQTPNGHLYGSGCRLCGIKIATRVTVTTEKFILKAKAVHGSYYDYSMVDYKHSNIKVLIICPKHGEFYQRGANHLLGQGCYSCGRDSTKLTLREFLRRANSVHGNKYDYSKVSYKDIFSKVCIICPTHGEFLQTPNAHLNGSVCSPCGKIAQVSKSERGFIAKAVSIHGKGKYDYSLVRYNGFSEKVCIICPTHGKFYQTAGEHLGGSSCRKCFLDERRLTISDFISRSKKIHGQKYDYSKASYKGSHFKVCIICPTHGKFYQYAYNHMVGRGCAECGYLSSAKVISLTQENFITRSKDIHDNKFNYSEVNYINNSTKVCIICPTHGKFYQKPNDHLLGVGCSLCKLSKGERAVERWLTLRDISFKHHYSFPDLFGLKRPLVFDFYVPHIKRLIEFDGLQHFKPVKFNGMSDERALKGFRRGQYYDTLKDRYCIKKGIPLLRINYKEFKKIPQILNANLLGMDRYKFAKPYINDLLTPEKADYNVEQSYQQCREELNV